MDIPDLETDGFYLLGDYKNIRLLIQMTMRLSQIVCITVIDTVAPQVALVNDFFSGTPLTTTNPEDFEEKPIVDTKDSIPESIASFLEPIENQFAEEKFNDNIFTVTLGDNENFYISLESDPTGIEAFLGQLTKSHILKIQPPKEVELIILHFLLLMGIGYFLDPWSLCKK